MVDQELTKKLWVNKLRSTTAAADYTTPITLLFIVISVIAIWLPGAHWLAGYGYEADYSFHPDDYRFIVYAKDFDNPQRLRGYPLFMTTQLFIINSFIHKIMHVDLNSAVVLRCITLAYAILSIVFLSIFLRFLGFSRFVSILSSFFLAFAPLHIILSHFGTADIATLFLFYLTIFAAWRYQVTNKEFWFHFAVASAGVTMAAKFYLPALIPPAIIIFRQPLPKIWNSVFVSTCVFVTFFFTASFFNFTPWDFKKFIHMLLFDNVVVEGGKSPLQQLILYPLDIIPCSGIITFLLAVIGATFLLRHFDFLRFSGVMRTHGRIGETIQTWLRAPSLVIVLPLLFHAALIVMAQVHFSRHILVFIPVVCLLAAIAIEAVGERLKSASYPIRFVSAMALTGVLAVQFADGIATHRLYSTDIRAELANFLAGKNPAFEASTFSVYTHLKGVSMTDSLPNTPIFVSCDLEYRRYILASQGKPVFHVSGGKYRIDFFTSLFADQTTYATIFDVKRKRLSLEDRLAEKGWIPEMDTYVPNECRAFQKKET